MNIAKKGVKMKKNLNIIAIVIVIMVFSLIGLAEATSIYGIPTQNGYTDIITQITDLNLFNTTTNEISFYIPLDTPGGTYGVDCGTSPDIASAPITGPLMTMYLKFTIDPGEVGHSLRLEFNDLDLKHYNDPAGFYEKLTLYGQGGLPNHTFEMYDESLSDLVWSKVDDDENRIAITFTGLTIQPGGGDFWLQLGFRAYSGDPITCGTWTNTCEKLIATVETTPVPEPSTWMLLFFGLVGMIGIKKKFR